MADDVDAQSSRGAEDDTHATSSPKSSRPSAADDAFDDDVTVLTSRSALSSEHESFPQGLSPRELAVALRGELLNHFHLQEFIGGGGMGAVFKALDTTLDRIVAVKVLASHSLSDEDLQRRFLVEAQSTARLDHPNIARIHFVGRDRGLPYIVFEYIDGVNLRDLVLNHGSIPLGDALSFACQIAHALAHAWEKEVVHRDIKPSNILVTREGQAKLVDMGLARLTQGDAPEQELTNTGVTLGTFDYISPEQARDPRDADTRSDIYSLGCTLFYMLAGHPPFSRGTAVQKLLQHQDQSPPNLNELRPDLPYGVAALVSRMLEKTPDRRPQNPSELVAEFYSLFQELGLQPPQALSPLPVISRATRASDFQQHFAWMLPLGALLLIGGWWGWRGAGSTDEVPFAELRRAAPTQVGGSRLEDEEAVKQPMVVEDFLEGVGSEADLGSGAAMKASGDKLDIDFSPLEPIDEVQTPIELFVPNEGYLEPEQNLDQSEAGLGFEFDSVE